MKSEQSFEIETYLAGEMTETERLAFENRLQSDKELSSLLELYRRIDLHMERDQKIAPKQQELQAILGAFGKKYFAEEATRSEMPVVAMPAKRNNVLRILAIAASVALMLAAYFVFFDKQDASQLANAYIKDNLTILSQTMDGAKDSIQQGIAAYNNKDYAKALAVFEEVYAAHPENSDALLYAGIANVAIKDHSVAIAKFTELSSKEHLFSNPGLFLKGVTLLQRNDPGDKEEARIILQQVVDEDLENASEAKEMLNNW